MLRADSQEIAVAIAVDINCSFTSPLQSLIQSKQILMLARTYRRTRQGLWEKIPSFLGFKTFY